jgi:hypothetical protein
MLQGLKKAWNDGDVKTFLTYFTSAGLEDQFDVGDQDPTEVVTENMADTGPITSISVSDLVIQSGNAHGIVDLQFENGFSLYEKWEFFYHDWAWRIGPSTPASRPIPAGVTPVALNLQEYAFNYDKRAVTSGNVAFQITNNGAEHHEVVLLKLDTDKAITDVVNAFLQNESDDLPAGIEFLTFGGEFAPREQSNLILSEPLAAGRYAFVCFLPSPDGVPHAALGMASDFTVGAGGGTIAPPNTGDAGLVARHAADYNWPLLALAVTLILGGSAGVFASRTAGRN